ncbi:MAG: class I SAM-dependent methyltransferase [Clostridiales bacterium]|nr:class I SAM-dependent methyltransferase [Clostridiales bacterium]
MINPFVLLSNKISCAIDNMKDKKISGQRLGVFVPTPYAESHGATGSQSAPYIGLGKVLKGLYLARNDSFVDIGCGKGRVIAYLLSRGFQCSITGIEINPEVASVAKDWTANYNNVEIVEGDAFGLDYNDYNVLFMYRPMETDTFKLFINLLEMTLTHSIRLYYYVDGQSGYHLNDRPGWTLEKRHNIFFVKGLFIHREPQRYSVWTYSPEI